jgi:hypothetical protein
MEQKWWLRNNQEIRVAVTFTTILIKKKMKRNRCYFNMLVGCNCDLLYLFFDFSAKLRNFFIGQIPAFLFTPRANFLAWLGTAASISLCCQSVKKCAHVGGLAPSHPGC